MFIDKILKKHKNETNIHRETPKQISMPSEFEEPKSREFHDFAGSINRERQNFSGIGFEHETNDFFNKPKFEKPETREVDKSDLILQKLETIEARLRLIENKLEK